MSAEDQTGLLLDETVCYWCHVFLKPSGSAPFDPKMTGYDDTTFRSHDPPGSVSSDEQSDVAEQSFISTRSYFRSKFCQNGFFSKSFSGSVSSCSVFSEAWKHFFWVGRTRQGQQGGAVVGLFCAEFYYAFPVSAGSFSGSLQLPPPSKDFSQWTRVLMQTYSANPECFSMEMTLLPAQKQWCWMCSQV